MKNALFIVWCMMFALCLKAQTNISGAEYFFDRDPGPGNGIHISANSVNDTAVVNFNVPTNSLEAGFHNLFLRFQYNTGTWGLYDGRPFYLLSASVQNAQQISAAEYFIDNDPGVGNGTAITVGAATDTASLAFTVPTNTLTTGFHNLFVRYRYSNGTWGLYDGRPFYVLPASPVNTQLVSGAEYFIDNDPGVGNGTPVSTGAGADTANIVFNVSTGGLSPGFHNIFVRYKYTNGTWGLYDGRPFYILPGNNTNTQQINAAEYFVDADPGVGNGTPINTGSPADTAAVAFSVSTAGLSTGFHNVFVRYRYQNGTWGLYDGRPFYILAGSITNTQLINAAEYFIDADPGVGNGTAISINSPADTAALAFSVSTSTLATGFHNIFVRYRYQNGTWGLYDGRPFYILPGNVLNTNKITAAEYFVDADPGIGNGTAISTGSPADTVSLAFQVSTATLSTGFHNIFIRYKYQNGTWGLYDGRPFYILPNSVLNTQLINYAEYFVDSDPGVGNGAAVPISTPVDTANLVLSINSTGLALGTHNLFIRYRYINGTWGLYQGGQFDICTSVPNASISALGDTSFCNSGTATLAVDTNGLSGATYEWLKNGAIITNATGITYNATQTGAYSCQITRNSCTVVSNSINVLIAAPPSATITPQGSTAICEGSGVVLRANTGAGYTYQWKMGGNLLTGDTSITYTATLPGVFTVVVSSIPGCVTTSSGLTVTIASIVYSAAADTICAGQIFSFNGNTYTTSGNYNDTLLALGGCDSVVTLALTVLPYQTGSTTANICAGQNYNFGGRTFTASGTYTDTVTSIHGCDSVITLNLTVALPLATAISQTICRGETYNGYDSTGVFVDTLVTTGGCDSIVTLNLTVLPALTTSESQTICQGQVYQGYDTTGVYSDTLRSFGGCDSIVVLTLTVTSGITTSFNQTVCYGQSFDGYRATGNYIDTFQSVGGCDSTRTLNLTVLPEILTSDSQAICRGQSFDGHNQSGTYIDTLTSVNNCDSIRTLYLLVTNSIATTLSTTICAGNSVDGHSSTGTYIDTFTAAGGCDSVRTLKLTVLPQAASSYNESICQGDSFQGHSLSGSYVDTFTSIEGCDSLVTLNLQVNALPAQPTISQQGDTLTSSAAAHYQWYLDSVLLAGDTNQILIISHSGYYSVDAGNDFLCSSMSNQFYATPLGIDAINGISELVIFPNPTSSLLNVQLKGISFKGSITLKLFDDLGNTLIEETMDVGTGDYFTQLQLKQFASGIYLLQLQYQGETTTRRVIVTQ